MHAPPPSDRSHPAFTDVKLPLLRDAAIVEAQRCLYCSDAPCTQACPTHIDVPQFIRKIATDNVRGSARTIFEANILGMSCARVCPVEVLCVGACVYNHRDEPPIAIGRLQRYATDLAYEHGWRFFDAGTDTGQHVALVGAGPASLAAAHELRRLGHRCTIFESREVIGGLNTSGVAPYKLQADRSLAEAAWILGIGGIEIRTGIEVGRDISLLQLEAEFDAVFLGIGLGPDRWLSLPGSDLPGVEGAVDWIERLKLSTVACNDVRTAVVVGGGNTAIDATRELRALGVPSVTMLYRRQSDAMSGYAHEWSAAIADGVRGEWSALPQSFEAGADGRVAAVRAVRVDDAQRPISGSTFDLPADLVLLAVGQSTLGTLVASLPGLRLRDGRIETDAHGRTGRPRWYAGGDCANGGKEVVNAAAEGKAAARAIDAELRAHPTTRETHA